MKRKVIIGIAALVVFGLMGCSTNKQQNAELEKRNSIQTEVKQQNTVQEKDKNSEKNKKEEGEKIEVKEQITYVPYVNSRYGFSIQYPSTFITKLLPDNGDGIIFNSPDGSAELTVSGSNNVLEESAASLYNKRVKEHSNAVYKQQQRDWYVLSWTEGDKIVYEKVVVGKGSMNTFMVKYPTNKKKEYDPILEKLNSTFKTPWVGEAH